MTAQALRLEVAEAQDADHWRWVLKDEHGAFLDDHAVALDPAAPMHQALFDLPGYLSGCGSSPCSACCPRPARSTSAASGRCCARCSIGSPGPAVKLRVLQYGVTRKSLREVLEEGEGWDVIHFSGHGLPGSLALERPDGGHDLIPSVEVAQLLRRADGRLKLEVLSACLSAAASIEQTRAWLSIATDMVARRDTSPEPAATPEAAPTLAHALTGALDCAVLAMRYPVEDEFATALAGALYDGLFTKRQPLPRAARFALEATLDAAPAAGALSAAAPALFGARAAELTLTPPRCALSGCCGVLSRGQEDAPWQQVFTARPGRRRALGRLDAPRPTKRRKTRPARAASRSWPPAAG